MEKEEKKTWLRIAKERTEEGIHGIHDVKYSGTFDSFEIVPEWREIVCTLWIYRNVGLGYN